MNTYLVSPVIQESGVGILWNLTQSPVIRQRAIAANAIEAVAYFVANFGFIPKSVENAAVLLEVRTRAFSILHSLLL